MTNKEINRESKRVFEGLLLPSWAFRSQEDQEDYGVDGEIEITTSQDQATGFIFKVQLKGTSTATYDGSGCLVYSKASVDKFSYYVSQLKISLIFVICDVVSGDCFWLRVQGNRQLETLLAAAVTNGQKEFTIKIPKSRKIQKTQESAAELIEAVESAADTITLRGLRAVSTGTVLDHLRNDSNVETTEKRLRFYAGVAANEMVRRQLLSGDFEAASSKAASLFESSAESPETRIFAGLSLVHANNVLARNRAAPGAAVQASQFKFVASLRMVKISRERGCAFDIRRYVMIYTRASRMHVNGRWALALAISEKTQRRQGDTMAGPMTQLQRMEASAKISHDFFKLCNAIHRLGFGGHFSVMPYALAEFIEGALPFVTSLRILDRGELAEAYVNVLLEFLPFCVSVAGHFEIIEDMKEILTSLGIRVLSLADVDNAGSMRDLLSQYELALRGEPKIECTSEIVDRLQKHVARVEAASMESKKPTFAELRIYFAERAAELGIDLNNSNDRFAQIVRIGLDDLDPTRVTTNCMHIHVMTTSYGMPAEMLGLPTAGSKRVLCLKHGHSVEALSLDAAYETFTKAWPWNKDGIRCENCPDKAPHPDGWEWSEEWKLEQRTKYQELTKRRSP